MVGKYCVDLVFTTQVST